MLVKLKRKVNNTEEKTEMILNTESIISIKPSIEGNYRSFVEVAYQGISEAVKIEIPVTIDDIIIEPVKL